MSTKHEESKSTPFQVPKVLYQKRYCSQKGFSILNCGGKDKHGKITNKVLKIKIPIFK